MHDIFRLVTHSAFRLSGKRTNPHLIRDMVNCHYRNFPLKNKRGIERGGGEGVLGIWPSRKVLRAVSVEHSSGKVNQHGKQPKQPPRLSLKYCHYTAAIKHTKSWWV